LVLPAHIILVHGLIIAAFHIVSALYVVGVVAAGFLLGVIVLALVVEHTVSFCVRAS
jgi:hypothetical protein